MRFRDQIKKLFWTIATPFFPFFRDFAKKCGYNPFPLRQNFTIGFLAPHHTKETFHEYLKGKGFSINRIAWVDDGEVLSVRILESFEYQYHLRLFEDGEIRGHYELTPEFSPLNHLRGVVFDPRREKFLEIIGECLAGHCPPNAEK